MISVLFSADHAEIRLESRAELDEKAEAVRALFQEICRQRGRDFYVRVTADGTLVVLATCENQTLDWEC